MEYSQKFYLFECVLLMASIDCYGRIFVFQQIVQVKQLWL